LLLGPRGQRKRREATEGDAVLDLLREIEVVPGHAGKERVGEVLPVQLGGSGRGHQEKTLSRFFSLPQHHTMPIYGEFAAKTLQAINAHIPKQELRRFDALSQVPSNDISELIKANVSQETLLVYQLDQLSGRNRWLLAFNTKQIYRMTAEGSGKLLHFAW
jgi:hypothetical protein